MCVYTSKNCSVCCVLGILFVAGEKLSLAIYMATVKQTNSTKKGARPDQKKLNLPVLK